MLRHMLRKQMQLPCTPPKSSVHHIWRSTALSAAGELAEQGCLQRGIEISKLLLGLQSALQCKARAAVLLCRRHSS